MLENMHISKTFKLMHSVAASVTRFMLVAGPIDQHRGRLALLLDPLSSQDGFKVDHRNRLRKEMVEARA